MRKWGWMLAVFTLLAWAPTAVGQDDAATVVYTSADGRLQMDVPPQWRLTTFAFSDTLAVNYQDGLDQPIIAGRLHYFPVTTLRELHVDTFDAEQLLTFALPGYAHRAGVDATVSWGDVLTVDAGPNHVAYAALRIDVAGEMFFGTVGMALLPNGDAIYFRSRAPQAAATRYTAFAAAELDVMANIRIGPDAVPLNVILETFTRDEGPLMLTLPSSWERGVTAEGLYFAEQTLFDYTYTLTVAPLTLPSLNTLGISPSLENNAIVETLTAHLSQTATMVDSEPLQSHVQGNGAVQEGLIRADFGDDWQVVAVGVLTLTGNGLRFVYTATISGMRNLNHFARVHDGGRQILGSVVGVDG